MEWRDDAIVLGSRKHGETSVVLEVQTRDHGRSMGLVRGGRSPRFAAKIQPGNGLVVTWRARLDEHLGFFVIEPTEMRAAGLMQTAMGLNVIQTLAAHLRLLPERDSHPELFAALVTVLDNMGEPSVAAGLVIRFEVMVLDALGFGLDLDRCALTEATHDLAFVSPRTGRAATRAAALQWRDRLLPLPAFLTGEGADVPPGAADLIDGFRLTGHFLAAHVWQPRNLLPPMTRDGIIADIQLWLNR